MTLTIGWQQPAEHSIVLVPRGVINYASAADLRYAISAAVERQPPPELVVVDLGAVESVDHTGVATLVVGSRICSAVGIDLVLRSPSPLIRRLLGMGQWDAPGSPETLSARLRAHADRGGWNGRVSGGARAVAR